MKLISYMSSLTQERMLTRAEVWWGVGVVGASILLGAERAGEKISMGRFSLNPFAGTMTHRLMTLTGDAFVVSSCSAQRCVQSCSELRHKSENDILPAGRGGRVARFLSRAS